MSATISSTTMLSLSLRRLPYNLIYSSTFLSLNNVLLLFLLLLLPVQRTLIDTTKNGSGSSSSTSPGSNGQQPHSGIKTLFSGVADAASASSSRASDQEAEAKLKAIFITDIKYLLTHNQRFYNTYGRKDKAVDEAFDDARLAAEVIYLHPELFRVRIQIINEKINDALAKDQQDEEENLMTADGVPVKFVDKYLLILGMMRGIVRFPE